jgi:hypothetical protein
MGDPRAEVWVVYQMTTKASPDGIRAVCNQGEWAAMVRARPGHFTLVRDGISSEGEAERLARGTAGDARPRTAPRRTSPTPWEDLPPAVRADAP